MLGLVVAGMITGFQYSRDNRRLVASAVSFLNHAQELSASEDMRRLDIQATHAELLAQYQCKLASADRAESNAVLCYATAFIIYAIAGFPVPTWPHWL